MVASPFHLFVATGLAMDTGDATNDLILAIGHPSMREYHSQLARCEMYPFRNMVEINRDFHGASYLSKWRVIRNNIDRVRKFVELSPPESVFCGNDTFPSFQCGLSLVRAEDHNSDRVHVDDGSASYNSCSFRVGSRIELFLKRIMFGRWLHEVGQLGTTRHIDRLLLIYPELAVRSLQVKPCRPLLPDRLQSPEMIRLYAESAGADLAGCFEAAGSKAMVFPSSSIVWGTGASRYKQGMRELCAVLHDNLTTPIVKYHPFERSSDWCGLEGMPGVTIVPQHLPAECLFLLGSRTIDLVVGDVSTSLLTARWLLGANLRIVVLGEFAKEKDAQLLGILRKLDATVVSSARELDGQMRSLRA